MQSPRTTRAKRKRVRDADEAPSWPWVVSGLAALGGLTVALYLLGQEDEEEAEAVSTDELADDGEPDPAEGGAGFELDSLMPPESTNLWVAGPAGNLYVRDGGEGHPGPLPVLFVHSLAGNGGQWALQLDHLRRYRRAVALDLRGHGDSDPAEDGNYSVSSLAADIAAVADQLDLRHFVLAGHSLGASVAIEYASRHPERVSGLLLVDPNGDQSRVPASETEPFFAALRQDPLGELESYFRQLVVGGDRDAATWVLEDLRLTHEGAALPAVQGLMSYQPLGSLALYPGPKLSVISDMNSLPFSLHRLDPDLPVHLLPGTGHWLMMDRPADFNRLLDEFVSAVEAGGSEKPAP
jgi:pimeloyl-ACP methyl ester carboxylesterase